MVRLDPDGGLPPPPLRGTVARALLLLLLLLLVRAPAGEPGFGPPFFETRCGEPGPTSLLHATERSGFLPARRRARASAPPASWANLEETFALVFVDATALPVSSKSTCGSESRSRRQ
jgi:hypothetical protein